MTALVRSRVRFTDSPYQLLESKLGVLQELWLRVRCAPCEHTTFVSIRKLSPRVGKRPRLREVLDRLHCSRCRAAPSQVAVLAQDHDDDEPEPQIVVVLAR